MAQAIHAAFGFAHGHPDISSTWHRDSQFLVVVNVPDQDALLDLAYAAHDKGIPTSLWREPDCDHEATALTLGPTEATKRLCSSLPLAGRALAA